MHLLEALHTGFQWALDHSEQVYHIAMTCVLVRNAATNKHEAPPNKDNASKRKKSKLKK